VAFLAGPPERGEDPVRVGAHLVAEPGCELDAVLLAVVLFA